MSPKTHSKAYEGAHHHMPSSRRVQYTLSRTVEIPDSAKYGQGGRVMETVTWETGG